MSCSGPATHGCLCAWPPRLCRDMGGPRLYPPSKPVRALVLTQEGVVMIILKQIRVPEEHGSPVALPKRSGV